MQICTIHLYLKHNSTYWIETFEYNWVVCVKWHSSAFIGFLVCLFLDFVWNVVSQFYKYASVVKNNFLPDCLYLNQIIFIPPPLSHYLSIYLSLLYLFTYLLNIFYLSLSFSFWYSYFQKQVIILFNCQNIYIVTGIISSSRLKHITCMF